MKYYPPALFSSQGGRFIRSVSEFSCGGYRKLPAIIMITILSTITIKAAFRAAFRLCFNARLSAKPFVFIYTEMDTNVRVNKTNFHTKSLALASL